MPLILEYKTEKLRKNIIYYTIFNYIKDIRLTSSNFHIKFNILWYYLVLFLKIMCSRQYYF